MFWTLEIFAPITGGPLARRKVKNVITTAAAAAAAATTTTTTTTIIIIIIIIIISSLAHFSQLTMLPTLAMQFLKNEKT